MDLPVITNDTLEEILEVYRPELKRALERLEQSSPEKAAQIRKGWEEDMAHFVETTLEPLYERISQLNPVRMHHDYELWEEISGEAEAGMIELFNIWKTEIDNAEDRSLGPSSIISFRGEVF